MHQWYEEDKKLYELEIEAMNRFYPKAKYGFLPDKRMYWIVNIYHEDRDWTLLCVYREDHPSWRWGYSIYIYPIRPNYEEMEQLVADAGVKPKWLPHMLTDDDDGRYFALDLRDCILGRNKGLIPTAAVLVKLADKWISGFEQGLKNQEAWKLFCSH